MTAPRISVISSTMQWCKRAETDLIASFIVLFIAMPIALILLPSSIYPYFNFALNLVICAIYTTWAPYVLFALLSIDGKWKRRFQ